MKKIKVFIFSLVIFFIVIFILFNIFIFNIFEKNYNNSLLNLKSKNSDICLYSPYFYYLINSIFLEKINFYNKRIENIYFKSKIGINLSHDIKNFFKKLYKFNIKYNKYKNFLSDIFKKDILILFYLQDSHLSYCIITKISFKFKFFYEISRYFIPSSIKKKYNIVYSDINSFKYKKNIIYFKRYRDLLIFSNNKKNIYDILNRIDKNNKKFQKFNEKGNIYININEKILKNIQKIPKFSNFIKEIKELYCIFNFTDNKITLNSKIKYKEKIIKGKIIEQKEKIIKIYKQFPYLTIGGGKIYIDNILLENLENFIRKNKNIKNPNNLISYIYKIKENYIKNFIIWNISFIDFEKENIIPLDPYPAITFFISSKNPKNFYFYIKKDIENSIKKYFKKENFKNLIFEIKKYAGREYIRIKFPDISGGAIKPAIGYINNFLIITTHTYILKTLWDIEDKIERTIDNNFYNFIIKNDLKAKWSFFIKVQSLNKVIDDLKEKLVKNLALYSLKYSIYPFNYLKVKWNNRLEDIKKSIYLLKIKNIDINVKNIKEFNIKLVFGDN